MRSVLCPRGALQFPVRSFPELVSAGRVVRILEHPNGWLYGNELLIIVDGIKRMQGSVECLL